jgi:putative glutamine amidotransferase
MKVIGIAGTHAFGMKERFKNYSQTYVNQDNVTSIIKAGALPIILPIIGSEVLAKKYIEMIDGLVLTGGKDIDPDLYNEERDDKIGVVCNQRDQSDSLYFNIALNSNTPILAICRGMQIANVLLGGTLHQDIGSFKRTDESFSHDQKIEPGNKVHDIAIEKDSFLFKVLNSEVEKVNSFHHQVIKKVAPSLKVTAKSNDGVIEALELDKENKFLLAVQ